MIVVDDENELCIDTHIVNEESDLPYVSFSFWSNNDAVMERERSLCQEAIQFIENEKKHSLPGLVYGKRWMCPYCKKGSNAKPDFKCKKCGKRVTEAMSSPKKTIGGK